MKMTTKLLSFLLAFVMLCGVVPNVETEVEAATTVTITSNDVINRANALNGTSYPAGYCMGFVSDFFAGFGATRSGACCAYTYGNRIITSTDKNTIPIGADVFFDNTGDAPSATHRQNNGCTAPVYGHIGVYIGNGNFIHVPSSGKVTVTSLSNSYWGSRFRGWGYHEYATVGTPSNVPVGMVDNIGVKTRQVTVSGWAYDRDDLNRAMEIHIYIGETCIGTGIANQYRPDVNENSSHLGVGEYHGFEIVCNVPAHLVGTQTILVYGIDKETANHPCLGYGVDGTVNIPDYVDIGTGFTALIKHTESSKMIESDINNSEIPHVRINEETGLANQLWYFERQEDGSYKISSCYDGTYLEVRDALYAAGTPIQTCKDTGSDAQKWYLYEQDGAYVFRSKLSDLVMDLTNNDTTNGNYLQTCTWYQSGAQIWTIYRNENTELKGPKLTVHAGDNKTKTTFSWTSVYGAKEYALYIHKNQIGSGELIPYKAGSATGAELDLPVGTYQAYVDSEHAYDYQMGNVVTFTVSEHSCTYTSVETNSTCTENGSIVYTCTACGESYTETLPATGHSYDNGVVTTEPTCVANGVKTFTCKNCGNTYTESISAKGHTETTVTVDATCVGNGYTAVVCETCGVELSRTEIPATGHSYTETITNATCTADGKKVYTCSTCSDTYTEILPATGHDYQNNVCVNCGDVLIVEYGVELHVSDAKATAGETVTVDIVLDKNVGFTYLNLMLGYDADAMELISVSNGTIVDSLTQGRSYIWAQADNATATGVLATLTFAVKEDAPAGDYAVTAEVIECCNEDEQDIAVLVQNGTATVVDFVYGDCNGDNAVNGKDVTRLLRYLANFDPVSGTSEFEISLGADVTGDGEINGKDVTRLLRYLANFDPVTGESSVELG